MLYFCSEQTIIFKYKYVASIVDRTWLFTYIFSLIFYAFTFQLTTVYSLRWYCPTARSRLQNNRLFPTQQNVLKLIIRLTTINVYLFFIYELKISISSCKTNQCCRVGIATGRGTRSDVCGAWRGTRRAGKLPPQSSRPNPPSKFKVDSPGERLRQRTRERSSCREHLPPNRCRV